MDLSNLMTDYKEQSRYEESKKLAEKWEVTGLLEGLEDENDRNQMAILMENEAKHLISETSQTQTAASGESWSDIALPLIRRTFSDIAAKEMVSVQPMSMPSGLIFYLDFKYGTSKPTNENIYSSGKSIFGNVSASSIDGNVYDYDFTYSKNYVSKSSAVVASCTSASFKDFNYASTISSSFASNADVFRKLTVSKSQFTNADYDAARGFTVDDSQVVVLYREYTKVDDDNVYFLYSGSDFSGTADNIEYVKLTTATNRGDFEAGQTGVGAIPEFNMDLRSEPIVPTTRKLKAQWTQEVSDDLNAYHSIDAEAELTNVMSDYIGLEIDMEIIEMLYQNALTTEYWSAKINKFVDSNGAYKSDGGTFTGTQSEWYQTLIQKIRKVANQIKKRTLLPGDVYIVVGTTIATILESMKPAFVSYMGTDFHVKYNIGMEKIGSLSNLFTVYKNPYFRDDAILVGAKGSNFLHTGAVYAPYIPLVSSPLVYDPDNFNPRKMLYTRSAKKVVRKEFFGKIIVRDTDII